MSTIFNKPQVVVPGTSNGLVSLNGVPGNTTATAIASGYVGEQPAGSLRSGTGGFTYSTRATVTTSGSYSSQISITLNAGIYLISTSVQAVNSGGSLGYSGYLAVGGTQVSDAFAMQAPVNDAISFSIGPIPVVITANSTVVAFYAKDTGVTSGAGVQEMWAVRIA
jgi:hypothetical protein